jgi:ergothioneine biosynthesis protein EgtB
MSIKDRFRKIRMKSVELCSPLEIEDYVPQLAIHTSPPKWHLAHTTWFFEQMILKKHFTGYREFDETYNFLFNSYYNTVGDRALRVERGQSRPTVANVYKYREYVDDAMTKFLDSELNDEVRELLVLGLNHEQQHQELLITDLKYTLSMNHTFPAYGQDGSKVDAVNASSGWSRVDEGVYDVGYKGEGFCFDNELNNHKVYLNDFEISNSLVTNGEFIEFMNAGGYADFNLWLDEGWSWVNENEIQAPLYWHKINGTWHYYTLGGLKPVDKDAILSHVNYYESMAFAFWKKMRLPTEFEWEIASDQFKWGERWEWTNSAYLPYPGFKTASGAVGEYNGKFMINQMVLRGSSVATAEGHSRNSYRNFFHPYYRWQYSGIRLVK